MDERYALTTGLASTQFGAISIKQLDELKVDRRCRSRWAAAGLLTPIGTRTYAIVGSAPSWNRGVWAAMTDATGAGFLAGRTAARLNGLDGFGGDQIEVLVPRIYRGLRSPYDVRSTSLPLGLGDTITIDGIRCLKPERLILDGPLFGFDSAEIENAIDSAIRLKLVSEQRLRSRVISRHRQSINNGRALLDALVDAGGESRLERWFLAMIRRAGLPHPTTQVVWRADRRLVARVDCVFDGGLIVEVAGHGTHSSRRQCQRDEQRRTELTLLGLLVITFTYDDIRDRPEWVVARLREALILVAAA